MNPENFLEVATILPEPLLLVNAEGEIIASNRPVAIMLGVSKPELQGKMLFDLVTEADEKVLDYLRACSRTREMLLGSLTFRNSDGEELSSRCEGAVIQARCADSPAVNLLRLQNRTSANSNFLLLNQKIKELTEETQWRKQAQENLSKTNERLKQTLDDLQKTQVQLVQTEKMSSLGKLVAGVFHEINHPIDFIDENIVRVSQYIQELLELVKLYEQEYPQPSANIREKIAAIDINFLQDDLGEVFYSMRRGTKRIVDIVKSLQNFSRVDEAKIKKVDIHEKIDNTLVILQHRLKPRRVQDDSMEYFHPGVEVIREYGKIPFVYCYPSQINQVFINILNNAIDALDELIINNNKLSINNNTDKQLVNRDNLNIFHAVNYEEKEVIHPQIRISTEVTRKNCLSIQIADNAFGMSDEIRHRIFDPFFTTKPVGTGTGIGLYICNQIITEKHGGKLSCFSKPNQGSEFLIEIPIQPKFLF